MVIDLIGVLEDGTVPRAPWVPRDTRRAIRVTAGESVTVRLRAVRPTGAAVELVEDDVIRLSARSRTARPSRALVTRDAVKATGGPDRYQVTIPAADTVHLGGEHGVLDIWLEHADGRRSQLVDVCPFDVAAAAAVPGVMPAAPAPGSAAPQDGTERSFAWVAPADGVFTSGRYVSTVAIPGSGMRDATYVIAGFHLRTPTPGDGPHPDAEFPIVDRTVNQFTVTTDAPIRLGSVYDVALRDSSS